MSDRPVLESLPLLGDFLDRRAAIWRAPAGAADSIVVLVAGALAALSQAADVLVKFFADIPVVALVLRASVPLLALAFAFSCVTRRLRPDYVHGDEDDATQPATRMWKYAHAQERRRVAKWLLVLLVPVCFIRLLELVPNAARAESVFAAFVCGSDGAPLVGGRVTVRSISGSRFGDETILLVDNGLLALPLPPWSLRPARLRVDGLPGGAKDVDLGARIATAKGCPTVPDPQEAYIVTVP